MLEAALGYARLGFQVFPANGKVPLTPNGFKDATRDPATIEALWKRWPGANVAIATGQASGIFVLDVDTGKVNRDTGEITPKCGEASLSDLIAKNGQLPETALAITGTGGRHYLFLHSEGLGNSAGRLGPNLDTRGDGGYIIAPPSVHPDTRAAYRWDLDPERKLAPLPEWIVAALTRKPQLETHPRARNAPHNDRRANRYAQTALEGEAREVRNAPEGQRNDSLNRASFLMGQLHENYGLSEDAAASILIATAIDAGLDQAEAERTFRSGWSAGLREPRKMIADRPSIANEMQGEETAKSKRIGRFEVASDGVYLIGKNDKGEETRHKLFPYLELVAEGRDHGAENWTKLLRFRNADDQIREWSMPWAMLAGGGKSIREILMSKGYRAPQHRPNAGCDYLLDYLSETVRERFRRVTVTGWHGQAFVLPDESFGAGDEVYRFPAEEEGEHAFRTAGTLATWQDTIGLWCFGNSRLAFAVSLAFAVPLLGILGEQGGGFHFLATTSKGKTTSLMVAASVWGGGGPEGAKTYLQQWRVTDNGLEAIAAAHTDALLCLDEIGAIDGRILGETAYMLANGQGKGRASRTGGARKRATWRTLYLSSGEVDLRSHVEAAGKKAKAGQEIRLAQIPYPVGNATWEALHGYEGPAAFADALQEAARRSYGMPIRAFLTELVKQDREKVREAVTKVRAAFVAQNVPEGSPSEVTRVAHRFALVAVAGMMATDAGIVPWMRLGDDGEPDHGEAFRAASSCFLAWLEARSEQGATEDEQAIAQVRHFLELHGQSRFDDLDVRQKIAGRAHTFGHSRDREVMEEARILHRAGFKRRAGEDSFEFLILPEVFKGEVCKGFNNRATARALADRGHLVRSGENDGRLARHERIPGIGKTRVYVISSSIFGEG